MSGGRLWIKDVKQKALAKVAFGLGMKGLK
jgi:hypothetical protein